MRLVLFCLSLCLSACTLETEEDVRREAERWIYPGEVLAFGAEPRCVAAAFRLSQPMIRGDAAHTGQAETAVWHIQRGETVVLQDHRMTPHELSAAVMSKNLARGLGLITSVTGPRDCMTDGMARGTLDLIETRGATLIYDPERYSVIVADFDRMLAVYMRTVY